MARSSQIVNMLKAAGGRSTEEIEEQKLQDIEREGGGLLGTLPNDPTVLDRDREEDNPDGGTPEVGTPDAETTEDGSTDEHDSPEEL